MSKITIQVNCPHCKGVKVKKNGKKRTGKQNFLCHSCKKQFQYEYFYKGADPATKELLKTMTLNGSGIRDIHRVLQLSIVCILFALRTWFKQIDEPCFSGSYKEVQIDEIWTFVKHRKQGKRWVWYAYDKETKKILAFQIGKRNDKSCKALLKKLSHLQIEKYCTDEWKSYKKYIPKEKHIVSKRKTTHIERKNRDFRTHLKRLCRRTVCFSKKDDMHYGIIKTYIHHRNAA
jgi:IS1 family transposase/transposase-like protein